MSGTPVLARGLFLRSDQVKRGSDMDEQQGRAILASLNAADPAVAELIEAERRRQESHLELIASENFASQAVMAAQGSVLLKNDFADLKKSVNKLAPS